MPQRQREELTVQIYCESAVMQLVPVCSSFFITSPPVVSEISATLEVLSPLRSKTWQQQYCEKEMKPKQYSAVASCCVQNSNWKRESTNRGCFCVFFFPESRSFRCNTPQAWSPPSPRPFNPHREKKNRKSSSGRIKKKGKKCQFLCWFN